jgi:hypothetical protein
MPSSPVISRTFAVTVAAVSCATSNVVLLATIDICTLARSGAMLDEPVPFTVIVLCISWGSAVVLNRSNANTDITLLIVLPQILL